MSTDKIAVSIIEEFVKKVRLATKSNQKEIRLSVSEAEDVAYNLNIILLKLVDKAQTEEKKTDNAVITIAMDGGGFEERR
jgi:hypothetical protein